NPYRHPSRKFKGWTNQKKGLPPRLQALCGTFTPTAIINCSKLTRFKTRLRLYTSVVSPEL
ncbi:MAG: hypothetical protein ABSF60_14275, partial [Verrucomicrobiota bacterium]